MQHSAASVGVGAVHHSYWRMQVEAATKLGQPPQCKLSTYCVIARVTRHAEASHKVQEAVIKVKAFVQNEH